MDHITSSLQNQTISGQKRTAEVADINSPTSASQRQKSSSETDVRAILADKRRGPHRKDRQVHRWTVEEDQLLQDAVGKYGAKNWKLVATLVPGRDHTQCLQRWSKCLAPGLRKGTWTLEEDDLLTKCVHAQLDLIANSDTKNRKIPWGEVCKNIKGRTAKQCRERWVNNLDPVINKGTWSKEEDDLMISLYKKYGPSWAAISKEIKGRTENGVKIRWKTLSRTKEGMLAVAAAPAPVFEKLNKPSKGEDDDDDDDSEDADDDEAPIEHARPSLPPNVSLALHKTTGSITGAAGAYYVADPSQAHFVPPPPTQQAYITAAPKPYIGFTQTPQYTGQYASQTGQFITQQQLPPPPPHLQQAQVQYQYPMQGYPSHGFVTQQYPQQQQQQQQHPQYQHQQQYATLAPQGPPQYQQQYTVQQYPGQYQQQQAPQQTQYAPSPFNFANQYGPPQQQPQYILPPSSQQQQQEGPLVIPPGMQVRSSSSSSNSTSSSETGTTHSSQGSVNVGEMEYRFLNNSAANSLPTISSQFSNFSPSPTPALQQTTKTLRRVDSGQSGFAKFAMLPQKKEEDAESVGSERSAGSIFSLSKLSGFSNFTQPSVTTSQQLPDSVTFQGTVVQYPPTTPPPFQTGAPPTYSIPAPVYQTQSNTYQIPPQHQQHQQQQQHHQQQQQQQHPQQQQQQVPQQYSTGYPPQSPQFQQQQQQPGRPQYVQQISQNPQGNFLFPSLVQNHPQLAPQPPPGYYYQTQNPEGARSGQEFFSLSGALPPNPQ